MNHIMFGEISAWFYKALGGINPDSDKPGFKNIIMKPCFVDGLDHFEAVYHGPYGEINSSWEKTGSNILYNVSIPPNSTAKLYLRGKWVVQEGNPVSIDDVVAGTQKAGGNASESDTGYAAIVGDGAQTESIIKLAAGRYVFLIKK